MIKEIVILILMIIVCCQCIGIHQNTTINQLKRNGQSVSLGLVIQGIDCGQIPAVGIINSYSPCRINSDTINFEYFCYGTSGQAGQLFISYSSGAFPTFTAIVSNFKPASGSSISCSLANGVTGSCGFFHDPTSSDITCTPETPYCNSGNKYVYGCSANSLDSSGNGFLFLKTGSQPSSAGCIDDSGSSPSCCSTVSSYSCSAPAPENFNFPVSSSTIPSVGTLEYGLVFISSVAGTINSVRFYNPQNQQSFAPIQIHIWDGTTQSLLATTNIVDLTTIGWISASISPLSISASKYYVLSASLTINYLLLHTTSPLPFTGAHLTVSSVVFASTPGNFPSSAAGSPIYMDINFIPSN